MSKEEFLDVKVDKTTWLLGIAYLAASRSDCKSRQVGAVITDDRYRILGIGYNGTVAGTKHCCDEICSRARIQVPLKYSNLHDDCMAVHAEMNALMQSKAKGTKLFCTTFPCAACLKTMLNFGIKEIYYCEDYDDAKQTRKHYANIFKEIKVDRDKIDIHYMKFMERRSLSEKNKRSKFR